MTEARLAGASCAVRSRLGNLPQPGLTRREDDVLRLRAMGLTSKEVGLRLKCSEQTAKNHAQRAFDKLGVRNIVEACIVMQWLDVPQ